MNELLLLLENEKNLYNLNIISLTETWHDTHSCNISLPGYDMNFSKKKKETETIVL